MQRSEAGSRWPDILFGIIVFISGFVSGSLLTFILVVAPIEWANSIPGRAGLPGILVWRVEILVALLCLAVCVLAGWAFGSVKALSWAFGSGLGVGPLVNGLRALPAVHSLLDRFTGILVGSLLLSGPCMVAGFWLARRLAAAGARPDSPAA